MDALTYLKEIKRMTKKCDILCSKCLFDGKCAEIEMETPEKAIEIIENWARENPVRTYKSVFFEKFPNALKNVDGYPLFDVRYVFGGKMVNCGDFTRTWDEEYQEPRP